MGSRRDLLYSCVDYVKLVIAIAICVMYFLIQKSHSIFIVAGTIAITICESTHTFPIKKYEKN